MIYAIGFHHVPILLSVQMPLGFYYGPASLPPPVTAHGFSEGEFLLVHTGSLAGMGDWPHFSFRPVLSQIGLPFRTFSP